MSLSRARVSCKTKGGAKGHVTEGVAMQGVKFARNRFATQLLLVHVLCDLVLSRIGMASALVKFMKRWRTNLVNVGVSNTSRIPRGTRTSSVGEGVGALAQAHPPWSAGMHISKRGFSSFGRSRASVVATIDFASALGTRNLDLLVVPLARAS